MSLMTPSFEHHPAPTYAPVRDLSYKTERCEVMRVALLMGWRLQPWQIHVVEIATEYRTNTFTGAREYHYHDVIVTVPRQSGKTTVVFPIMLHRAMTRARASVFFTAQTGQAARHRIKDFVDRVTDPGVCKLAPYLKGRMEAGAEGVNVLANRSQIRRFSPTPTGLHGETPELVVVDEFWAFTALEGDNLTGAIGPAQITRREERQTWWISTMGTAHSEFMNGMVEAGRAGDDPKTAYFEWSLPEDMDPEDPASWELFHPAVHNTITLQDLQDVLTKLKAQDKMGEWLRAYCNRKTGTANPLIQDAAWAAMTDEDMTRPERFAVAYEVAPGNALCSVSVAWRDEEGEPFTRVLLQRRGTAWLPGYIAKVAETLEPSVIAADDGGPTRRLTDVIRARFPDLEITTLNMAEFGSACMGWLEAVRDVGNLHHDGSEPLASAVTALALKSVNGVERFTRDEAPVPVAAAIGSAVALWAWDRAPEDLPLQIG